ncbi:MAG: UvrD-helicase domain-containing protein, partial [Rhodobacteraceae bacterium]|nr:UvrD-helicase domain-containing protein [Paracoccaceae bacterium]
MSNSDRMGAQTPWLCWLNNRQREAVQSLDGPVLVLAGAGTGKTRVLISRIAELLQNRAVRSDQILAVTFTNKAANEMKHRIEQYPVNLQKGMQWMGTFHSVCVKLLRRHAELAGLNSNFTILDTDDQHRLLKQLIQAANIDAKRWPERLLAGVIDRWKNRASRPDKVPTADAGVFDNRGVELYAQYQARLKALNAVDFGDLLLHMVTIFQKHADVLALYQGWFRYILVDEYQDTNVAQYMLLRLLAAGHKNICCVGDDDQAIYGWRGAEVGNILRFEQDFPGARVVRLEQNYRSTPHILAAASGLIRANQGRLGKALWTKETVGEQLRLIGHWDGEEEARWIGEDIEALIDGSSALAARRHNPGSQDMMQAFQRLANSGTLDRITNWKQLESCLIAQKIPAPNQKSRDLLWRLKRYAEAGKALEPAFNHFSANEIAILVRTSHQMRAFEDRFLTIGLPYRVIGGPRFYERMEIRDAMAYFRIATSSDDDLAFERIMNTPKRALGDRARQTIRNTARSNGVSLLEGARLAVQGGLIKGKGGKALEKLVAEILRWNGMIRGPVVEIADDSVIDDGAVPERRFGPPPGQPCGISHVELARIILDESGYTAMWQNDKTPDAPGRLENLKELVRALDDFENLQGFLEHVALIMDNENQEAESKVSIMTLHAAKGLEFPVVFLPGWEDGLFPSQRSVDENGIKGLEEERRLAYVGITRAEEVLTISFVGNRQIFGKWHSVMPSRFIDELPADHVEVLTPPGLYGGGYRAVLHDSRLQEAATRADGYNSPGWKRLHARISQPGMSPPHE